MKKIVLFLLLVVFVFTLPTQGVSAQGSDSSAFISESAPYDDAQVQPGASFTKSWTLLNNGSTTWTTSYTLTLIEGAAMGPTSVNLTKEVKPGESIDIAVSMTAPAYGGVVINRYQLKNASGALFGAKPYILVNVSAQLQPTPGPGQQVAPQVGGPDTVTLNLSNGVQVQATQPPPGGAYVPYGNNSIESITKEVCTTKYVFLRFFPYTSCETQTLLFELPSTPTSKEINASTTWQGNSYQGTFFALAPAMSMSLAAQGATNGTITVVGSSAPLATGGLTSASAATFVSAAAPLVLVGVLICGGIVLMYYAQATALPYTGPAAVPAQIAPLISTAEWDNEMALAFGVTHWDSTRHQNSTQVLTGLYAYSSGKKLKDTGDGKSSGSIKMFAGIGSDGTTASVAILHVVGTQMNFLVLKGRLSDAGFCAVPSSCLDLGGGKYLDTASGTWVAAWTLSKAIGKADNPADYLTVGQGWEAWKYYQSKYNLYIPVLEIRLP